MMDMATALAQPEQPMATFAALEAKVREKIGAKLFTVMTLDRAEQLACRCYSNMPDAYPTSGAKPMKNDSWSSQVIERHETFVANSIEEIAVVFPDHELIQSLGCESCINIPVTVGGDVIGTLNCLHEAGHYTPDRVSKAESLKESGALALLLAAMMEKKQ